MKRWIGMDFFETLFKDVQRAVSCVHFVCNTICNANSTDPSRLCHDDVCLGRSQQCPVFNMKQPHYSLNAQHFYAFCADLIIFCEWSCWRDVEQPSSCTSMTLGKPILKNEPHKKKKNHVKWTKCGKMHEQNNDKENQSNYKWRKGLMFSAQANFEVYSWIILACLNALESFPKNRGAW